MENYIPSSLNIVLPLALSWLAILILGYFLTRWAPISPGRILSWGLVAGSIIFMDQYCRNEPPGFRMLSLIVCVLLAMKVVVLNESRKLSTRPLKFLEWICFSVGWLGMQPQLFQMLGGPSRDSVRLYLRKGLVRILLGCLGVLLARFIWDVPGSRIIATGFLLVGLSLILHFGIFNLVTALWRACGIDSRSLFQAPLYSQNLAEFWGRRWNIGFSEMTSLAVYRPVVRLLGRRSALLASFIFSGILHEVAISLPVRKGFGLPLLYFILQGVAMFLEEGLEKRGYYLRGWPGHVWTLLWLALPIPLLFHPPFLRQVIWPIIGVD